MALVLKDRVKETTATTGTGTITLDGATVGYQSFLAIGNANTTYYCIAGQGTVEWEVGIGTYTASGATLSRDTVLASSNSGSAVNFSSGTKDVFVVYPAGKSVNLDASGNATALGTPASCTVTNFTGTASININGTVGSTTPNAGAFTTLSASSTVTLSAGTANGVGYLNGSKVLTTGSALTFDGTTLTANALSVTNGVTLSAGTANGVLYLNGSKVATSGSALTYDGNTLFLYSATANLSLQTSVNTNQAIITLADADGRTAVFRSPNSGSPNLAQIGTTTNHDFAFLYGNTEQMRLTSTGLGIGTTSPSYRLDVQAPIGEVFVKSTTGTNYAAININNTGGNFYAGINNSAGNAFSTAAYAAVLWNTGNYPMTFATNNSEKMRLDASGNLGIGTSSPGYMLEIRKDVQATTSLDATVIKLYNALDGGMGIEFSNSVNGKAKLSFGVESSGPGTDDTYIGFSTCLNGGALTERARITSGGSFQIGSATLSEPRLYVYDNDTTDAAIIARQDGSAPIQIWQSSSAVERARITSGGNFGIGTTNPLTALSVVGTGAFTESLSLGVGASTASVAIEVGAGRTGNGYSYIDLIGDATYTDYGLRIIRNNAGANTTSQIIHRGTGDFNIVANDAAPITFNTNGSERARIDSSGNFGLGVTPSASNIKTLEINNAGNSISSSGLSQLLLSSNAYYNSGWKYGGTGSSASQIELANGTILFFTAPSGTAGNPITFTQAMTLDSSGNLGVGTTSPVYKLEAAVGTAGSGQQSIANFRTADSTASYNAGFQVFATASSTATSRAVNVVWDADGANASGGDYFYINKLGNSGDVQLWQYSNAAMLFATNNAERARITSDGDLFVGTTTASATERLSVKKAINGGVGVVFIENTNNVSGDQGMRTVLGANANDTSSYHYVGRTGGSPGDVVYIYGNGNIVNQNNSYGTLSDQKLKTDIVDVGSQWADIKAVRFRKFKMKNDPAGIVQLGVVAQELEQTSPGLIDESNDIDDKGNNLGTTTKSVKTSVLLMKAAVALQEAMARIEQLETKVAALESK